MARLASVHQHILVNELMLKGPCAHRLRGEDEDVADGVLNVRVHLRHRVVRQDAGRDCDEHLRIEGLLDGAEASLRLGEHVLAGVVADLQLSRCDVAPDGGDLVLVVASPIDQRNEASTCHLLAAKFLGIGNCLQCGDPFCKRGQVGARASMESAFVDAQLGIVALNALLLGRLGWGGGGHEAMLVPLRIFFRAHAPPAGGAGAGAGAKNN